MEINQEENKEKGALVFIQPFILGMGRILFVYKKTGAYQCLNK